VRHDGDDLVAALLQPRTTSTALYAPIPPVTPSATRLNDLVGFRPFGSGSSFFDRPGDDFLLRDGRFLVVATVTRGVDPASSWRARWPAVTTNSNELVRLAAVNHGGLHFPKCLTMIFGFSAHALQTRALGRENRLQSIRRGVELAVHDDEIVFDDEAATSSRATCRRR